MSIIATLRLPAQPEKVEKLKSLLKTDLPDTRRFKGCQAVSVYQDEDVPESLVVWGTWDSRDHFEKYLAWRTERGDQDGLGAMLAAPPSISYLDLVDA
jgi:quinol monooxygenase YgiN